MTHNSEIIALTHNSEILAYGIVRESGEKIHGYRLKESEILVEVTNVLKRDQTHPVYKYPIEVGSYTQWPMCETA